MTSSLSSSLWSVYIHHRALIDQLHRLFPRLSYTAHKGQAGKLGLVGGASKYTGAPYYASISALKTGCDLATVFCSTTAAIPIKCYSPELMVHGIIPERGEDITSEPLVLSTAGTIAAQQIKEWLPKLTVIIVGPGLSRDKDAMSVASSTITAARTIGLPIVIDADAISLICDNPSLISSYKNAIITPNGMEFKRLSDALLTSAEKDSVRAIVLPASSSNIALHDDNPIVSADAPECLHASLVARRLGGVTILSKGGVDIATNGERAIRMGIVGSPRRCGGQGDMLAGITATLFGWASKMPSTERKTSDTSDLPASLLACYGGSLITRTIAQQAFAKHERSMLTTHLIEELGPFIRQTFPMSSTSSTAAASGVTATTSSL